jgi:hypothetical protein
MNDWAEEEVLPATGVFGFACSLGLPAWGLVSIKMRIPSSPNGFGPAVRILLHPPVVNRSVTQQFSRQEVTDCKYEMFWNYLADHKAFWLGIPVAFARVAHMQSPFF